MTEGQVVTIALIRAVRTILMATAVTCALAPARAPATVAEVDELTGLLEAQAGVPVKSAFPWKRNIITTFFWIGNNRNSFTSTVNYDSAWDQRWHENFGGEDDPNNRDKDFTPKNFIPTLNPFYVALPFNDMKYPELAKKWVPWYSRDYKKGMGSVCKGKWIAIHYNGRVCFGTWQDVGPFRYDNASYVFGDGAVGTPTGAGLDVSPAIRDYLGLPGKAKCDWRFVEANEVPPGPWIGYEEQEFIVGLQKMLKEAGKKLPTAAKEFKLKRFGEEKKELVEDALPAP